jgi:hypothetical protein
MDTNTIATETGNVSETVIGTGNVNVNVNENGSGIVTAMKTARLVHVVTSRSAIMSASAVIARRSVSVRTAAALSNVMSTTLTTATRNPPCPAGGDAPMMKRSVAQSLGTQRYVTTNHFI